jgi:hypothetical protein
MANAWIPGGHQSDFARSFTRERHDFAELPCESWITHSKWSRRRVETFGTLNFGGSTATTVSFVVTAMEGF